MKVTIFDSAPGKNDNGLVQINDARIIYRDFSGRNTRFSDGKRSFSILIDDDGIADALEKAGYPVKRPDPSKVRDDGSALPTHMKVKVRYSSYGPDIYLVTNGIMNKVPEESVDDLDRIRILSADLDIRAYDYDYNGRKGRAAYLNAMRVYQQVDRFMEEYNSQHDEDAPF